MPGAININEHRTQQTKRKSHRRDEASTLFEAHSSNALRGRLTNALVATIFRDLALTKTELIIKGSAESRTWR